MSSTISAFYSDARANSAFLSLITAISWSFFDLQSGVTGAAATDVNLVSLVHGAVLFLIGCCGAPFERTEAAAALRRWPDVAAGIGRGLLGILDITVYVYAQKMVPVGDVVLFSNLAVVYTSFADSLWRRRAPSALQWVSILLCVAGLILVTRPSFIFDVSSSRPPTSNNNNNNNKILGYSLALVTGLSMTGDAMLVGVFKDVPMTNWMLFLGVVVSLAGAIGGAIRGGVAAASSAPIAVSLSAMAILNAVGQFTNMLAVKIHTPTLMALVTVAQVPMSYTLSWVWLGQDMDSLKIVGVVLVTMAVVLAIVGTRKREEQEYTSLM